MPHDIFISHTKQDKLAADAACAMLEKNGIRCWIATRDVPFGSNYAQELGRAIKGCRAMLIIFSGHTNLSRHVLSEITLAFNEDKTLLPLRIEQIDLTEDMDYFLRNSNWLDAFTPPLENHLQRVADNLLRMFPDRVPHKQPVIVTPTPVAPPAASPVTSISEPKIEEIFSLPEATPTKPPPQPIEAVARPSGATPPPHNMPRPSTPPVAPPRSPANERETPIVPPSKPPPSEEVPSQAQAKATNPPLIPEAPRAVSAPTSEPNAPTALVTAKSSHKPGAKGLWLVLGAAAFGILVAFAVMSYQRAAKQSRIKTITNNLRQFSNEANQYMLDKGVTTCSYTDFVGTSTDDYIHTIIPVMGEDYSRLQMYESQTEVSIQAPDGTVVTFEN